MYSHCSYTDISWVKNKVYNPRLDTQRFVRDLRKHKYAAGNIVALSTNLICRPCTAQIWNCKPYWHQSTPWACRLKFHMSKKIGRSFHLLPPRCETLGSKLWRLHCANNDDIVNWYIHVNRMQPAAFTQSKMYWTLELSNSFWCTRLCEVTV